VILAIGTVAGCQSRSVGSAGDGGGGPDGGWPDGTLPGDGAVWPDGGGDLLYGTVDLEHEVHDGDYPYELAILRAWFYPVDHTPPRPADEGFVETRVTHDNVECDIYFVAPRWDSPPPSPFPPDIPAPLPPLPGLLDVGDIQVESPFDQEGELAVSWEGTGYGEDQRSGPPGQNDLPSWLTGEPLSVLLVLAGNQRLPAADHVLSIPPVPVITEPADEGEASPDANGLFRIAWEIPGEPQTPVELRMDMNMDWDNATFRCRPPAGHAQVLIPQTWMQEYSWGHAELRVIAHPTLEARGPGHVVRMRVRRARHRSVRFDIGW
jgi:hypothetical protein